MGQSVQLSFEFCQQLFCASLFARLAAGAVYQRYGGWDAL